MEENVGHRDAPGLSVAPATHPSPSLPQPPVDFIFYSVLVGRAAMYDFLTVFATYLAIIAGEEWAHARGGAGPALDSPTACLPPQCLAVLVHAAGDCCPGQLISASKLCTSVPNPTTRFAACCRPGLHAAVAGHGAQGAAGPAHLNRPGCHFLLC